MPFDATGPHAQGAWAFELAATGPREWELRERDGDDWVTSYRFDDQRQHPADVVMANHFTSTYPRSPFASQVVAARKDADSIRRLRGRQFTVIRPDRPIDERTLDDAELADALRGVFGIPLTADELAQLVAAIPASK